MMFKTDKAAMIVWEEHPKIQFFWGFFEVKFANEKLFPNENYFFHSIFYEKFENMYVFQYSRYYM